MLSLSKIQNNNNCKEYNSNLYIYNIDDDIGKKLYIPCYIDYHSDTPQRVIAFVDTGADLNIIQMDYLLRLFPELSGKYIASKLQKTKYQLKGYTGHAIPIIGVTQMSVALYNSATYQNLTMYVVDSPGQLQTPLIISLKTLGLFKIKMQFETIINETVPYLESENKRVLTYYYNDIQLNQCFGFAKDFLPSEVREVQFTIAPCTALTLDDKVLISQDNIPYHIQSELRICPSTSIIQLQNGEYMAKALVKNIGSKIFTGAIKANVDLCTDDTYTEKASHEKVMELQKMKATMFTECYPQHNNETGIREITISEIPDVNPGVCKQFPNHLYNINVDFPDTKRFPSNPDAVNNDVKDLATSLTEERYPIKETPHTKTPEEIATYYDPKQSIQLGFMDDIKPFSLEDMEPEGLTIPTSILQTPSDIVKEENFDPEIWKYVKDVFIDTYPSVIARHTLDTGRISDTLGFYRITLKPNVVLPVNKKIYYNSPLEAQALRDVLEALIKQEVIIKAACKGDKLPSFASPAFLVKKASNSSSARLVVDFKLINECIAAETVSIPNFASIVDNLRGAGCYSSLDLKNAFNSISIHPDSQPLTQFVCQFGCFYFKRLPTGMNVSPNCLNRFCDRMLNYSPKKDEKDKVIYDEDNYPIMEANKLDGCEVFYDDLIIFSKPMPTFDETIKEHFKLLKTIVGRLAFHNAKIDIKKLVVAKFKISFLGWIISNNFIIADPKRVEKLKEVKFPRTPKGMRSFIGLINSFRLTTGFDALRFVHKLTPLTSSKLEQFRPTEEQRIVFEKLREQMISSPLFCKVCLPGSSKILCTDAASENYACYSAVLMQHVPAKHPKEILPDYLYLDDKTHRIIFDNKLPCRPIRNLRPNEDHKEYRKCLDIKLPPEFEYLDHPTLGYADMSNSLGESLQTMLIAHRCSTNYLQICEGIYKYIKTSIIYLQLLSHQFNNDKQQLNNHLNSIKDGTLLIDDKLYIFHAISKVLHRKMKVVNSTQAYEGMPVITFDSGSKAPPFFFLLYLIKGRFVVRPTLLDAYSEYNLSRHRGSLEVILYFTKNIPEETRKCKILDLELYSLLNSLAACKKLVGRDPFLALVDSKPLFFLFNSDVYNSITKIARWGHKIRHDFPQIILKFIGTMSNPADFLSRKYDIPKVDLVKLRIPKFVNNLLDEAIPSNREFTLNEWIQWVADNKHYLEYCVPKEVRQSTNTFKIATLDVALKYSKRNVKNIFNPIRSLEKILTHEHIIQQQKADLGTLYKQCESAPNHIFMDKDFTYSLNNGLLYIQEKEGHLKIMIPDSLLASYVAMAHLTGNHTGYERMVTILENYYHVDLNKSCRRFSRICFACQLCNSNNRQHKLQTFPLTSYPCETLYMDLMENIGPSGQQSQYNHILLVKCPISNFMLLLPMKTKTSAEFLHIFTTCVYQTLHPKQLWTDNGPFISKNETLATLALLGVEVIYSSAYSPMSHGSIEVMVRIFKSSLRKYLSIEKNLNWSLMAPVISHLHNSAKITKSKYSPYEILYGQDNHLSTGYLDHTTLPQLHPTIQKHKEGLETKNKQLKQILKEVQERIEKEQDQRVNSRNKSRITRQIEVGDFCFVRDYTIPKGSTKPLRTKFLLTPFVVIYVKPATVLLYRLTDGLVLNRHKNDIKKYISFDPDFTDLPPEVLKICQQASYDITTEELEELIKNEDFDIEKFDVNSPKDDKLINEDFLPPPPEDTIVQEDVLEEDEDEENEPIMTRNRSKMVTFAE